MQRALALALKGFGYVAPNPMVGCVIVHDGKVIGEGYHKKFGEAHAEVNAVNAVKDKSLLGHSTVYVTLEPCAHFGKTPPCADLLISHKVRKVVVATVDSNPLVAGKGIAKLRQAGIEVSSGVLEEEAKQLNKRFFTFIGRKRPYIILKWAQTADGFISRKNFDSKWISSELSRQLVHRWRAEEAAILVGKNTVLHDDPQLNVRTWTGPDPVRIVIDMDLSLPRNLKVFSGEVQTLVYNAVEHDTSGAVAFIRVDRELLIAQLIADVYQRGLQSVIVEGGAATLKAFIEQGFWDEARVFTAPKHFGEGIPAPAIRGEVVSQQLVDTDLLSIYKRDI